MENDSAGRECNPKRIQRGAVSDELAPWTSLSCPFELVKKLSTVVQGGDSFNELVEELRL